MTEHVFTSSTSAGGLDLQLRPDDSNPFYFDQSFSTKLTAFSFFPFEVRAQLKGDFGFGLTGGIHIAPEVASVSYDLGLNDRLTGDPGSQNATPVLDTSNFEQYGVTLNTTGYEAKQNSLHFELGGQADVDLKLLAGFNLLFTHADATIANTHFGTTGYHKLATLIDLSNGNSFDKSFDDDIGEVRVSLPGVPGISDSAGHALNGLVGPAGNSGPGSSFVSVGVNAAALVGSAVGVPPAVFHGSKKGHAGPFSYDYSYTTVAASLSVEASLSQNVAFRPDPVTLTAVPVYTDEHTGLQTAGAVQTAKLGSQIAFDFDTPTGDGTASVQVTYSLGGHFEFQDILSIKENVELLVGKLRVGLGAFGHNGHVSFGPLLDKTFTIHDDDITLASYDVNAPTQTFTTTYSF